MLGQLSRLSPIATVIQLAVYLLLASFACVAALPEPTSAQVAAARVSDPELSLEDLRRGRAAYIARCGNCHVLRSPLEHAPEAWPLEVQRMQTRHQVRLTPDEQRDIVRYLRTASQGEQQAQH
jgi:mono/diheme cytochrome c family protein